MNKKLSCILLIDDDRATNFLNKMILDQMGCCERVVAVESGPEGLDFLKTKIDGKYPHPELLFLDINMPGMNGWEFLEQYKSLDEEIRAQVVLMMLTTSLNPDDFNRAEDLPEVKGYLNKPLNEERMAEVLRGYFPDLLL